VYEIIEDEVLVDLVGDHDQVVSIAMSAMNCNSSVLRTCPVGRAGC
jgi:hypothetical protein